MISSAAPPALWDGLRKWDIQVQNSSGINIDIQAHPADSLEDQQPG